MYIYVINVHELELFTYICVYVCCCMKQQSIHNNLNNVNKQKKKNLINAMS